MDKLKALLKGVQQGTTLQTGDELAGMIPAAMEKLGVTNITEQNRKLAEQGFTGDIGPTNTNDLYKEARDADRQEIELAREHHPELFNTGMAGGAVLGALTPGPTVLRAPNALSGAIRGAGFGAVQGLGSSTEDSATGVLGDMATSAAIGGAGGAAFSKLKDVIGNKLPIANASNKIGKVKEVTKEGLSDFENISHKQIMDRMEESGVKKILERYKNTPNYDAYKQKAINLVKKDLADRAVKKGTPDNAE